MLERIAIWYLSRRGAHVMRRDWVGICVSGGYVAASRGEGVWIVSGPKDGGVVALNRSIVKQ